MSRRDDDATDATDATGNVVELEHARAAILRYLAGRDGRVENLELVSVTVREAELENRGLRPSDLPVDHVHERVTSVHLPELDADGLVDYDRREDAVELVASSDEVEARGDGPLFGG